MSRQPLFGHCGDDACSREMCECACEGCESFERATQPDPERDFEEEAANRELLRDEYGEDSEEFSETAAGHRGRERWARHYDDLNGAPESDYDR